VDIAYDETPNPPPPAGDLSQACTAGYPAAGQASAGLSTDNSAIVVDLDANMIPIVYTGNTSTPEWQTISSSDSNWYDYTNKKWANAVTVTTASLATYKNTSGTTVNEADILGYWVYIPRYRYQVMRCNATDPVVATPTLFNIQFENQNTQNYQKAYPAINNDWATHPAFTLGETELNGLWVSKFEASNPTTSRVTAAENIYFKPNQLGVSYNNVSTQFTMSRNIGSDGTNAHNLATLVSTMLKNDQWGAIAYLTTSVYGRGTSEIWINNCDDDSNNNNIGGDTYNDHTGWAGTSASASSQSSCSAYTTTYNNSDQAYHGTIGVHASTTDNVYGIYDMSGGNFEYVMGNYDQTIGSSGFSTLPDAKYYNNYPSSIFTNNSSYTNNNQCTWATCGGHALHETKTVQSVSSYNQSWGSDYSIFVDSSYPWFARGGSSYHSSFAGVFASRDYYGGGLSDIGFRVVLGPF
jgi:hypothetical protein